MMTEQELEITEYTTELDRIRDTHMHDDLPYNPLIQATHCFIETTEDTNALDATQQKLLDNLDIFQQIVEHYYAEGLALISIYILCYTMDSLIAYRLGQHQVNWHKYNLVTELFQYDDECSVSRLLNAVDFVCQSDETDTQLLEFVYLCMNLSAKDKPELTAALKTRVDATMEKLYDRIYNDNEGFSTELSIPNSRKRAPQKKRLPAWLIAVITGVIILTLYSTMTFLFQYKVKRALHALNIPVSEYAQNDDTNRRNT